MKPNNINQQISFDILNSLYKHGVLHAFVSPGLRNAPLIWAAIKSKLKVHSVVDERTAGYQALGIYQSSGEKSVLICTSGTAYLNYLPSVAEAHKSNIPLFIISADRPGELVKNNANQTIDQKDFNLSIFTKKINLQSAKNYIIKRKSFQNTLNLFNEKSHTLHINLELKDPLDSSPSELLDFDMNKIKVNNPKNSSRNVLKNVELLSKKLLVSKNPLLIIGSLHSFKDKSWVYKLIKHLSIPTYVDITSGLKKTVTASCALIPSLDHPEVREYYRANKPDLIIRIGQYFISKHLYEIDTKKDGFIFQHEEERLQVISKKTSKKIQINLERVDLNKLKVSSNLKKNTSWEKLSERKRGLIDKSKLSMPFISKYFLDKNPKNSNIVLGNSSIIRSFDYYISHKKEKPQSIIFNRGVSGIEGLVHTALGCSLAKKVKTILFTGDISFIHDLNSLASLKHHEDKDIVIFIVNNFGGGIFRSIPIKTDSKTLDLMTTAHNINITKVVKSFGIKSKRIETKLQYKRIINSIDQIEGIIIYELVISEQVNTNLFKSLQTLSN